MKKLSLLSLVALFLALLVLPQRADAQVRSFRWSRHDVTMTVNDDGSMDVVENMEINFNGFYSQGYVTIDTQGTDGVDSVSITGNGVAYRRDGRSGPTTFQVTNDGDTVGIDWYFPEPATGVQRYELSYRVNGVVRVADDGDQILWRAIREDHPAPVDNSRVIIRMPDGVPALATTARVNGLEGQSVTTSIEDAGATVVFEITEPLSYNEPLDVGVRWEHGLLPIEEPDWQRNERFKDVFTLLLIAGSILLLITVVLSIAALWYLRGRDPDPAVVPTTVPGPPDDLSPGVVGTLLDEKADMHDILAILMDLARRGYVEMEESKRDFTFRRGEEEWEGLAPYESKLLNKFFGKENERKLSSLKQRFYKHIPAIRKAMYEDLETRELVDRSPESVRNRYYAVGGILTFFSGFIAFIMLISFSDSGIPALVCPPITLFVGSLLLVIVGRFMPRKTQKGVTAAARWEAFKKYMEDLQTFGDQQQAQEIFERYLPYAVAFGLERRWLNKFKRQPNVMPPPWYIPYPRAPHRTPMGGSPGGGSGPSLDKMAGGMTGGLDTMASSMTRMLDNTAKTLRSTPPSSSSGSSGGSSFSGGFSGGSSGGGSSGFR